MAQTGVSSTPSPPLQALVPWRFTPWFLWFADVLALEVSLLLAIGLRALLGTWWPIGIDMQVYVSLALALVVLPLFYLVWSLYPGYGMHPVERLRRTLLVTSALFLCVLAWSFLFGNSATSRGILLFTAFFALLLVPIGGALAREVLLQNGYWGNPVVILGANPCGVQVAKSLQQESYLGLIPIGFLDNDPKHHLKSYAGLPVLGGLELAPDLSRSSVREALIALPELSRSELGDLLGTLPFINVVVVPDLGQEVIHWSVVRELGLVHGIALRKNLLLARNQRVKLWMDKLLAWPLFLLSLPIIGLMALWVWLVSPPSPFYAQEREGLGGKVIRVWKLRTMFPDAQARLEQHLRQNPQAKTEWEQSFKLKHDPRILPVVGQFLRRTSLDELPQLYNVVRGEMSLVGPRPFPLYHLKRFPANFRQLRHSVLPGITGFWQVWARSDSNLQLQEELDTYYIRNWSPWLDIYLLSRTVLAVLFGRGAY